MTEAPAILAILASRFNLDPAAMALAIVDSECPVIDCPEFADPDSLVELDSVAFQVWSEIEDRDSWDDCDSVIRNNQL